MDECVTCVGKGGQSLSSLFFRATMKKSCPCTGASSAAKHKDSNLNEKRTEINSSQAARGSSRLNSNQGHGAAVLSEITPVVLLCVSPSSCCSAANVSWLCRLLSKSKRTDILICFQNTHFEDFRQVLLI